MTIFSLPTEGDSDTGIPDGPWVIVPCDGVDWLVWPDYLGPMTIGEGLELAKDYGCELPTPRLVDAIHAHADLHLEPKPRRHNGTWEQMASKAVLLDQQRIITEQIAGREYRLLSGCGKDIVQFVDEHGRHRIGIYGWHVDVQTPMWKGIQLHDTETPGSKSRVIQPASSIHDLAHGDYSQLLRLTRRAA